MYTIICRYQMDGMFINFDLDKMLKRLNIIEEKILDDEGFEYGVDHNLNKLVRYNVNNSYKVQYIIGKCKPSYNNYAFCSNNKNDLISTINYLNETHDKYLESMDYNLFLEFYKKYGNNYIISNKLR